ncbi:MULTISPECIES: DUF6465 family protein [Ruminococcus]|uniref:Uncharacterized protein n=1 Tax=Ruminococcus albus (strain ATCC 27210 / DSM 20455 / JCM 14654 / NCDO 2250 / 7) TaxID=697329 RepID=E6UBD8_RUMA7|nr:MULTISPECIES: DUF6465 family protein [Ruminococcus]ADU21488.1 hypothetical protein Rumal_0962 [Ruminococcus albus 7 = DSM 20455]MCR5019912.1 DUF6465 family protein [Ruminococcus sp.]
MANTKKTATKAAEVAAEVKEVAAKTKSAAKKTAAKAAAKTKAAVDKVAEKDVVYVEFADKQLDVAALVEAAKADYKAKGHRAPKAVKLYIKPEEGVAYYTVNDKGDADQKIDL